MRLEVSLSSTVETAYDVSYHHALRSALWECLREEFAEAHDANKPVGLSFSNIYPWGDLAVGDNRTVRIASPKRAVLDTLAETLLTRGTLTVGDMGFHVEDVDVQAPGVGEPGTRGYLETATGVVCRITPSLAREYGLSTPNRNNPNVPDTFWRPEHGLNPLKHVLNRSIKQSHDQFGDTETYDYDMEQELFNSYEPIKDDTTYAVPFEPTAGVERTYIVSKWRLGYRVRDETHRYLLNLALDCGVGQRREHGFGFANAYTS